MFQNKAAAYQHKQMHEERDEDNGGDNEPWDVWKVRLPSLPKDDPDPNAKKKWKSGFIDQPIPPHHLELDV